MLDTGFGRIISHDGSWKMGHTKESDLHGYGRRYNPSEPTYYDSPQVKDQLGLFVYGIYQPDCYYDEKQFICKPIDFKAYMSDKLPLTKWERLQPFIKIT